MKKVSAYIRHNPGIVTGFILSCLVLLYVYSCQSTVVSLLNPNRKITRQVLVIEVDTFLSLAAERFEDLDRQDMVKGTIFNSLLDLAQGKSLNPIGIISTIAGILGIGAVADNIKKRTHINTLKGDTLDEKVKEKLKEILQPKPN